MRVHLGESKVLHVDIHGKAYVRLASQVQNEEGQALEDAHIAVYEIRDDMNEALIAESMTDMIGEVSLDIVFDITNEIKKNLHFVLLDEDGSTKLRRVKVQIPLDMGDPLIRYSFDKIQLKEKFRKEELAISGESKEDSERIRRSRERYNFNRIAGIGRVRLKEGWVLINAGGEIVSDVYAEIDVVDNWGGAKATILGTNVVVYIDRCGLIIDENTTQVLTKEEAIIKKREEEAKNRKKREEELKNIKKREEEANLCTNFEERMFKERITQEEERYILDMKSLEERKKQKAELLKQEIEKQRQEMEKQVQEWKEARLRRYCEGAHLFQNEIGLGRITVIGPDQIFTGIRLGSLGSCNEDRDPLEGWVVINDKGQILTSEIFDRISEFDETKKIARARKKGWEWDVYINQTGQIVDETTGEPYENPESDQVKCVTWSRANRHFHEEVGIGRVHTDNGWSVINSRGEVLKAEDVGSMFGCKDQTGAERLHWSLINNMFQPKVGVGRVIDTNGWSLLNNKGETITTEIFEKIEAFDETRCTAKAKSAHRNFQVLINPQGQIVDERTGAPAGNDYLDVSKLQVDITDEQFTCNYTLPALGPVVEDLFFNRLNHSKSVEKARWNMLYIFSWLFTEDFQREIVKEELASVSNFKSNLGERVRLMTEEKQKNDGTTPSRVIQSDNWKGELEKRFGQLNEVEVFALEEFWSKLNTCNNYGRSIAISFVDLLLEHRNCFSSLNEADISWVWEHFLYFYQMDAIRSLGDLESFDAGQMKYDEDYSGTENLNGYRVDLSTVKEFVKQSPRLSYEVFWDDRSIGCMDKEKGHDHLFIMGDDVGKEHQIEVRIIEDNVAVSTVFSKTIGNCRVVKFC